MNEKTCGLPVNLMTSAICGIKLCCFRYVSLFVFVLAALCIKAQEKDTEMNNHVYEHLEHKPQFEGGEESLFRYIYGNLKYPEEDTIQGRVYVRFVVSKTGEVKDVEILKSVSPECDTEAIRVLESLPNWIPGMYEGEAVDAYVNLSIAFKTNKSEILSNMKNSQSNKSEFDREAQYQGGESALINYIYENLKYPDLEALYKIEGTVLVGFIVSKKGKVVSASILKGLSPNCNEEALRVIRSMPDWTPSKYKDKVVDTYYTIPIEFKLSDIIINGTNSLSNGQRIYEPNKTNVKPQFEEGSSTLSSLLSKNIKYPSEALEKDIQGQVLTGFMVSKTGQVSEISIIYSLSPECDAEAVRLLNLIPDWTPGMVDGEPVNVYYTLSISFKKTDGGVYRGIGKERGEFGIIQKYF